MEMKKGPLFSHLSSQNIQENTYFDSTWKGLTALGGLYFMFLVEHVLTLIKQFKDKKKKVRKTVLSTYYALDIYLEQHLN
jgi:zinc transporter 6